MVVLVAVDDSEPSRAALETAAELVTGLAARVVLMTVSEAVPLSDFTALSTLEAQEPPVVYVPSPELRRAVLEDGAERLRARGVEPELVEESGNPAERILAVAERVGADFVVLGSHGRSGVSRFLLGSVSERVARHASCSVLIARKRAAERAP